MIEAEHKRQEALRLAQEAYEAKLREQQRARQQAEEKHRQELREKQAIQEKLRRISPCPMGFQWSKVGGGWRCGGGSHFVSNAQLHQGSSRFEY